jgi:hypothetical protein
MQEEMDLVRLLASRSGELLPLFFLLMWRRSNGAGPTHELRGIRIPDTVVLHHSRPIHWFFTSKDGCIRVKSKRNLTTELILEHMSKKSKRQSVSGAATQFVAHSETESDGVHISFQSIAELPSFVSGNNSGGLLQQYVDPKQDRGELCNSEIVSNWTPSVMYLERRVNEKPLKPSTHGYSAAASSSLASPAPAGGAAMTDEEKRKQDLTDRCTASETGRFVRTQAVVSARTLRVIEEVSCNIAEHLNIVFNVQVTNLTLHIKIDKNDDPVVLRCSALRCIDPITRAPGGLALELRSVASAMNTTSTNSPSRRAQDPELMSRSSKGETSTIVTPHASTGNMLGARNTCVLCGEHQKSAADADEYRPPLALCHVARRHLLLPLSVMDYFHHQEAAAHETSTTSSTGKSRRETVFNGAKVDAAWTEAMGVPAHVKLINAGDIRAQDYKLLRHDKRWLDERLPLCQHCADSVHAVTSALHVDGDGNIRRPTRWMGPAPTAQSNTAHREATARSPSPRKQERVKLPPIAKTPTSTRPKAAQQHR